MFVGFVSGRREYRCFFFFSSRRRHTRWNCDWSSDVCSSDLAGEPPEAALFDVPLAAYAGYQVRDRTTEIGLVADDHHGFLGIDCREDLLDRSTGRERFVCLDLHAERRSGLLRADCGARDDQELLRQVIDQPLRHSLGLLFAFRRELALEIGLAVLGIGMPPEDELHALSIKFFP